LRVKRGLKIDFGGGLKSDADLKIAFKANQSNRWYIAVKNRAVFEKWIANIWSR
jgi:phosphoribosylformimino-5-aminoimidazole carboxamide ribotide isomerase